MGPASVSALQSRLYNRLRPRAGSGGIIEEIAVIAEKYSRHAYFLLQLHNYVNRVTPLTNIAHLSHSPPYGKH